jgi:hypothetical protein
VPLAAVPPAETPEDGAGERDAATPEERAA